MSRAGRLTASTPSGDPAAEGTPAAEGSPTRAAASISGLTAASRVTGFGRVLAVTAVLGTTYLGNTYQAANTVPNVIFELFVAGALHAVLVPTLVQVLDGGGQAEAERVAGAILGRVLAGLGVLSLGGLALSPLVMRVIASGVADATVRDAQIALGTVFLLIFVPQVVLYGWGLVATGMLHAQQRFTAPAAAPIANNVVVVSAYIVFWVLRSDAGSWPADGLSPLEVAVLAGGTTLGVAALIAVPVVALGRGGFRLRPRWERRDPIVARLVRHGGWAVLQVGAAELLLVVVLVLANAAAGGVVAFQFSLTFFLLPFALVAMPVATAIYPTLSRSAGDVAGFRALLGRGVVAISVLLLAASALLFALAWPIVRVAAFGQAADAGLAPLAHSLAALAPGLIGYGLVFLLARAFYALGDVRTPASVLLAVAVLAGIVMVVAAPHIALAERVTLLAGVHSGAYLAAAAMLLVGLRHRLGHRLEVGAVGVALVAAVVVGAGMAGAVRLADPTGRVASLLVGTAVGLVGLAAYVGLLRLGRHPLNELVRLEPARG